MIDRFSIPRAAVSAVVSAAALATALAVVFALLLAVVLGPAQAVWARQATPNFQCPSPTGYGARTTPTQVVLDLQCQPALGETLDIPAGGSITVTVNLANYYTATGRTSATFNIHLAMDRARITLRQADSLRGTDVTDTLSAMGDVLINTSGPSYLFIIENKGVRSAVFDLSLRPR
jgi:hypothetical protein